MAIGNGWIDARRQYPSYLDFAVKVGILEEKSDAWKAAKARTDECMADIAKITSPEPITAPKCEGLLLDVTAVREKKWVLALWTCSPAYPLHSGSTARRCA